MSDLLPIRRESLSEQAYRQLREALMRGGFKPGQRLVLRSLARELGISATPVREALFRLVSEQALSLDERGSVLVPVLDRERFAEIRDLRLELEGRGAFRAAELADEAGIEELAAIHERMRQAKAAGDTAATLLENERFHFKLCALARLPVLYRIVESLWMQSGPLLNRLYEMPAATPPDRHEHLAVLAGLRDGDGAAARAAIQRDIADNGRLLIELLPHAEAADTMIESACNERD
ncbi:GntR family transcriptional regulator [Marinimicrococcus flavescens]|uniref:GntR family transcriptional regulator n=1 Tax=Marinimicrococcus flavescens TaxID=3031815 RepID=A0AAP3XQA3_9PROT|nr:GntR family transcriptional regulator [Marinimicrococcus flavescens]